MVGRAPGGVSGARCLVRTFEELDVDVVFGLPGVHNLELWDELSRSGIRLVGVRHEQTAAYAADGYARASGKVGVSLVTSGPGAANAVAGTGEAKASGSPIIVLATDIPSTLRRPGRNRGVLHETDDQAAMFDAVTKATSVVGAPEDLVGSLLEAYETAVRAPAGPVYLGVPTDLLSLEARPAGHRPTRPPDPLLVPPQVGRAVALLGAADRPLILAGGGAARAESGPALGRLAERIGAPLLTTYGAKGLLPPDHPCAVPWTLHAPPVGALWDEADVVLVVGSDLDGMTTQNWALPKPPALILVNVSSGEATKNYEPDLVLIGDAKRVAEALVAGVAEAPKAADLVPRLARVADQVRRSIAAEEPQASAMLDAFSDVLTDEHVLAADMCVAGYWLGGFHPSPRPRRFLYPVGWGTLGFAFPASIGAALSGAERAVCVCGDGGFLFACGELATVAQEELPITIVLVDDRGYGMLRYDQAHSGKAAFGVDLHTPDFVAMARSFGVEAAAVPDFGAGFRDRLAAYLDAPGPNLLVVAQELLPPLNTSPRWYRQRT